MTTEIRVYRPKKTGPLVGKSLIHINDSGPSLGLEVLIYGPNEEGEYWGYLSDYTTNNGQVKRGANIFSTRSVSVKVVLGRINFQLKRLGHPHDKVAFALLDSEQRLVKARTRQPGRRVSHDERFHTNINRLVVYVTTEMIGLGIDPEPSRVIRIAKSYWDKHDGKTSTEDGAFRKALARHVQQQVMRD